VIKRYVDVHATVFLESGKSAIVPPYVKNHGILSGPDLHQLLQQSKVAFGFIIVIIIIIIVMYIYNAQLTYYRK